MVTSTLKVVRNRAVGHVTVAEYTEHVDILKRNQDIIFAYCWIFVYTFKISLFLSVKQGCIFCKHCSLKC
jgi:hypothetical protein